MTWRSSFAIAVTLSVMLVIGNIVLAGSNPASATGSPSEFFQRCTPNLQGQLHQLSSAWRRGTGKERTRPAKL